MKLSHTHKMCVLSSIVPRPLMLPTPSLLPDLPALGLEQPSRYRRSTNQDLVSSSEDSAQSSPTCHTSANILRSLVFKISKNENDGFPRERNHLPVFEIFDLTLWHVYVKLDEHGTKQQSKLIHKGCMRERFRIRTCRTIEFCQVCGMQCF